MKTRCPKCETIKDTSKSKPAFVVSGEDYFPKRRPITTFCDECGTEFNITLNSLDIEENYNESALFAV